MKHLICSLLVIIGWAAYAAEPMKADAPWAVYLPTDPTDMTGSSDANKICHGDDVNGWKTYMVIQTTPFTVLTNNSDLYGGGVPLVTRQEFTQPSATTGYIILEFLYVDGFNTPTKDLATCDRYDGTNFLFGSHSYELSYMSTEKTILDKPGSYWISTREMQQKTWFAFMTSVNGGDLIPDDPPLYTGTVKQDIQDYLTEYSKFPYGNQFGLTLPPADYVDDEMALHCVTLANVEALCNRISTFTSGKAVRIPNEREWEYATRAADNLYAPANLVFGAGDWTINDPVSEAELSIPQVFDKTNHPTDIPYNLTREIYANEQTGVDGDGNAIYENLISSLEYELFPELETNRDFKFIFGQDINYDKRYPATFVPFKRFLKKFRSLNIKNSSRKIDADCYLSCDENGVDDSTVEKREYYLTDQNLARAVQGLYMPVDVNGHYAATFDGTYYKYDDSKVSHFELVGISGTPHGAAYSDAQISAALWPRNHGPNTTSSVPAPAMTPTNTVMTYFAYVQHDKNNSLKGRPALDTDVDVAAARAKLQADVRDYSFANSPHGIEKHGSHDVLVDEHSNIAADIADIKRKIHGLNRSVAKGNPTHKWYYVYTNYGGGNPGDPNNWITPSPVPISNFAAHEKNYSFKPGLNNWEMMETCGNVSELCIPNDGTSFNDRWDGKSDYSNHTTGGFVVVRGGSWNSPAPVIRYGARRAANPDQRSPEVGFRIVIEK